MKPMNHADYFDRLQRIAEPWSKRALLELAKLIEQAPNQQEGRALAMIVAYNTVIGLIYAMNMPAVIEADVEERLSNIAATLAAIAWVEHAGFNQEAPQSPFVVN